MKKVVIYSIIVLGVIGLGYAAYALIVEKAKVLQPTPTAQEEQSKNNIEAKYIANMLAQIEEAKPLARRATEVAKHGELKDMAKSYLELLNREETQLNSWQAQWGYDTVSPDSNRLPRYVDSAEHEEMRQRLLQLEGDAFDKLFLEYFRVLTTSDVQQTLKVDNNTVHDEVDVFAAKSRQDRYRFSNEMSEWPEQWGYVPPHDG